MGMGRSEKEVVIELNRRIELCETNKEKLLSYINQIKNKCLNREITFSEYEALLNKKLEGKTLQEWLEYYDSFIENCKEKIKSKKRKNRIKKYFTIFFSLLIVSVLIFSFVYFKTTGFTITGKTVEEPVSESQEQVSELPESLPEPEQISETTPIQEQEPEQISETLPIPFPIQEQEPEQISETTPIPFPIQEQQEPPPPSERSEEPASQISETEAPTEEPTKENKTEEISKAENLTEKISKAENVTEEITTQQQAVIGEPVKWVKRIRLEKSGIIKIKLPKQAKNISVNKIIEDSGLKEKELFSEAKEIETQEAPASPSQEQEEPLPSEKAEEETKETENPEENKEKANAKITAGITGMAISEGNSYETQETSSGKKSLFISIFRYIFNSIISFLKNLRPTITGQTILTQENVEEIEVTIEDTALEYEITYETEAPQAFEEEISRGKRITISSPETIHYENVLAYTELPETFKIKAPESVKIYWVENQSYLQIEKIEDKNNNGIYDYIEWIAPFLSNQTFEIILITKAVHLDENRTFISDIYEQVKELDELWSEPIYSGEYVRVTFEKNLTSDRDITIYPRVVSGTPKIEVYEFNGTELIAEFSLINSNEYNKVYLTNLQGSQDTFDLQVKGGSTEINHIIDPTTVVLINADALATATGVATALENVGKNIVRLNSNNLIAFWTNAASDPSCSLSSNEGTSWGAIQTEAGTDVGVAIATNGTGAIYITTNAGNGAGDIAYIHQPTGACDTTKTYADVGTLMLDNYRPDVAYDEVHNTYVVCSMDDDDFDIDFAYTSTASISWTSVNALSGAVSSTSCSIDVDDNGNVFIASNEGASGIRVYNSSAGTFASTTTTTAYSSAVNNMHLSIRGTEILITAIDGATNDLVIINSSDGISYSSTTYEGTFQDPEGCIDENGNYHIVFVNGTVLDYIRYAKGVFDNQEIITDTGTERYPSVRCSNFPLNNRLGSNELELVFTDTGTNIYFANTTIDISIPDTSPPLITISHPTNVTYNYNTIDFNVTAGETLSYCVASTDGWTSNTTMTISGTSANLTNTGIADGSYDALYWCNDTANNINNTENVTFSIDTTAPLITIVSPLNQTYSTSIIDFNVTADEWLSQCNFTIDNGASYPEMTQFNTTYFNFTNSSMVDGQYTASFECNDTNGNLNNTENVTFISDANPPTLTNENVNDTDLETNEYFCVNITATDTIGIDTILAEIWNTTDFTNYTMLDNGLNCDEASADNVYSASIQANAVGEWNYSETNANDTTGNSQIYDFTDINISVITSNTAPQIIYISLIPNTDPTENSYATINFNLSVYDDNGISDINNDSISANFTKENEAVRENITCAAISGENTADNKEQNFTCDIEMWYFDANGNWNITVLANDSSDASVINDTTIFQYNLLQSIEISPQQISFDVAIGAENQTSTNDPTFINNTGNYNATGNLQIQAYNLHGSITSVEFIDVSNFTADLDTGGECIGDACTECDAVNGTVIVNGSAQTIAEAILERGNLSITGTQAQEQLYYCIRQVPSTISSQTYSTQNPGSEAWLIRILAAVLIVKRKKRRKKEHLIITLNIIAEELKENYSKEKESLMNLLIKELKREYKLNNKQISGLIKIKKEIEIPITIFSKKLGALESVVKYMKENLNLSYREIASLLQRNERTIWTAYNKAKQKLPEALEIKETDLLLPISTFNKNLTILESVIVYLRKKGIKYAEIAKLLNRDQRNIWTIYSRAVRKIKRKI